MYTSPDFAEHIAEHFLVAEKMLADYDPASADLYKNSLSSSLTLLDFLERLEAFLECFDSITKGIAPVDDIFEHLFATTEYSSHLEGDKVIIREEYQPETGLVRETEIPLSVYGSLLKSLHKHIKSKSCYTNGQIIIIDKYFNGKRFGEWKAWYENGQVEFIGTYKNNIRVGEWKYFYDNGKLSCLELFNNDGKRVGISRRWYKSGQLASERYFDIGENRGLHMMWNEYGKLIYSGKDQIDNGELLFTEINSRKHSDLHKIWEEFVIYAGKHKLSPGLTSDNLKNYENKIPTEVLEILKLNNGQISDTEGIIRFLNTNGNNFTFIFLNAEQILQTLNALKQNKDVYFGSYEHCVPFAIDDLKRPDDFLCYDTKEKKVIWLWVQLQERGEPFPDEGYVYSSICCADSLDEFLSNRINFIEKKKNTNIEAEKERQELQRQEDHNNFKKNLKEQQLGNTRFWVSLPEGYFINERPGPDFTIYYLLSSNKDNYSIGAAGIYIGGHPNSFFENRFHKKIQIKYHRFVEQIPAWNIYESDEGGYGAEAYITLGQFEKIHLFANADRPDDIAKWAKVFETLREHKEEGSENKSKGVVNGVITLYDFKSDTLRVNIEAYFEGENLVIDGCDLGTFVKEMFDDGDYEYKMTVPEREVRKLYAIVGVEEKLKEKLLLKIYDRYYGESCFSGLKNFFDLNNIKYEYFSWT